MEGRETSLRDLSVLMEGDVARRAARERFEGALFCVGAIARNWGRGESWVSCCSACERALERYYYIAVLLCVGIRIQKADRGGRYALAFVIS